MRNDGVQFEFMGFDPEYEIKKIVAAAAESLQFKAPSDSAVKLVFRSGMGVIQASCRIISQAGTFVAESVGETPIQALQQIEEKISGQLKRWKQRRFQ